jgi:hypothetical protein
VEVMTTDEDFVRQRQREDTINYLVGMTNFETAPRLAPAMRALRAVVAQAGAQGVPWTTATASALRASDVAVKTVDNLMRKMVDVGFLIRTGEYDKRFNRRSRSWSGRDNRRVALGDWPEPS